MSYRIPATNNYFGLEPVAAGPNSNFQTNLYLVSSSEATQINVNELVVQTSKNTAKSVAGLTGTFVVTSSVGILGVAASVLAPNAGSTNAELLLNTSQMVMLYDDLLQVYSITESSSGVIGPQTGLYKNYGLLATGVIGSTGPFQFGNAGRSNMALSGVESSVTGVLHVIALDPVEKGHYTTQTSGSAVTDVRKWLVRLNSNVDYNVLATTSVVLVANTSS